MMRAHKLIWSTIIACVFCAFSLTSVIAEEPTRTSQSTAKNKEISKCIEVTFIEPDTVSPEAAKVLDSLKIIYESYLKGDWETFGQHIDQACTKYDAGTNQLYEGRKAVIQKLQQEFLDYKKSDSPLLSYTIDHPYVRVKGDSATVTFIAIRKFGGINPKTLESHCSDIFLKEDGKWKKVYYRSQWKQVRH